MMPATQSAFQSLTQLPEELRQEIELKLSQAFMEQVACCRQLIEAESLGGQWGTEVRLFASHIGRVLTVPEVIKRYHHPYKTAMALTLARLEREGDDVKSLPL